MIAVVYICWGAFILIWLSGYLYNLARAPRSIRARGGLGFPGWAGRVLIGLGVVLLVSRRGGAEMLFRTLAPDPALSALGAVVLVVATIFTLWARISLGTMWSSAPTIKEGHQLRTDGPYRLTRHPIYTGMLGMFIGTTILTTSGLVLIGTVAFGVYVVRKIEIEERLLIETFGDQYRRYRVSVPALIPFLIRRR